MIKKISLALIFCLAISSCGFQVIYREEDAQNKVSYEEELATIRLEKSGGRLSQELRNAIKDTFNPDYIDVAPKYVLSLKITPGLSGTFITSTGASGRNKVTLSVEYKLYDALTGKFLATGLTTVNDNYDVQTNRYGTYVAEDFARSNLTKVAAINLRNLLVNDLIELKKNPERDEPLVNGVFTDKKVKEREEKEALAASCVESEFEKPTALKQTSDYSDK